MKKLLLIPTCIFPYTVCLCLAYGFITRNFSGRTIGISGILVLVTLALSFVCNLIYIFTIKEKSAYELLKTAFLIKAIHIPTYIFIFILGFIMGLMFYMTFPFVVLLIFVDLLTLWMSGMIGIHSIAKSLKDGRLCSKPLLIVAMICQFFFCADIISSFVVMLVAKKNKKNLAEA